ncbi:MAG: isochorismatase family protein [Thermodesulfobacteriota bacterium]
MGRRMIQDRLTPFNCVVILIDFQADLLLTIDSIDVRTLIENAMALSRMTSSFGIPTILTTIGANSFGGPLLSQLQTIFPKGRAIECTTMSVWEEDRVKKEVERTGRRKLVMTGLWTDFCVALSATQAVEAGYEVYVVIDACGDLSKRAQDRAVQRMTRAGAIPVECRRVLFEFQQQEAFLLSNGRIPLSQGTGLW